MTNNDWSTIIGSFVVTIGALLVVVAGFLLALVLLALKLGFWCAVWYCLLWLFGILGTVTIGSTAIPYYFLLGVITFLVRSTPSITTKKESK